MKNLKNVPSEAYAPNIGSYISKKLFQGLYENYQAIHPNIKSSFFISKDLLLKVMGMYKELTGIRFMFGLTDSLNPNTVRIFLVPCTHATQLSKGAKPLISSQGYYDHTGKRHSVVAVAELMANFVQSMVNSDNSLKYKEVTRGSFFGKNSLQDLVKDEECRHLQFYFGLHGQVIKPILEPVNEAFQAYAQVYMDFGEPCPDFCGDNPSTPCTIEAAVSLFSAEEELDDYRNFRDNILLTLEGGASHFELYYFLSPLISVRIQQQANPKVALEKIYHEQVVPFKNLMRKGKYQEANDWLKETFNSWIAEWNVAPVFEI